MVNMIRSHFGSRSRFKSQGAFRTEPSAVGLVANRIALAHPEPGGDVAGHQDGQGNLCGLFRL